MWARWPMGCGSPPSGISCGIDEEVFTGAGTLPAHPRIWLIDNGSIIWEQTAWERRIEHERGSGTL